MKDYDIAIFHAAEKLHEERLEDKECTDIVVLCEEIATQYDKDPEQVDKDLEEAFNKTYPEWLEHITKKY